MNDFEIARKLGASSFLVFKSVQAGNTDKELLVKHTGLSKKTITDTISKLKATNLIKRNKDVNRGMYCSYSITSYEEWRL
jgi:DNA-binding HxlR family transcriptional regulator